MRQEVTLGDTEVSYSRAHEEGESKGPENPRKASGTLMEPGEQSHLLF